MSFDFQLHIQTCIAMDVLFIIVTVWSQAVQDAQAESGLAGRGCEGAEPDLLPDQLPGTVV